jgi:hypothetical protein
MTLGVMLVMVLKSASSVSFEAYKPYILLNKLFSAKENLNLTNATKFKVLFKIFSQIIEFDFIFKALNNDRENCNKKSWLLLLAFIYYRL